MRTVPPLELTAAARAELMEWADGGGRMAQRARICLLAATGIPNSAIARLVGLNQNQVGMWRQRCAAGGIYALQDRPRPGRPRKRRTP